MKKTVFAAAPAALLLILAVPSLSLAQDKTVHVHREMDAYVEFSTPWPADGKFELGKAVLNGSHVDLVRGVAEFSLGLGGDFLESGGGSVIHPVFYLRDRSAIGEEAKADSQVRLTIKFYQKHPRDADGKPAKMSDPEHRFNEQVIYDGKLPLPDMFWITYL